MQSRHDPSLSFAELVTVRERGRLKVYIGSAAGVGKTYRMLQEAHDLRRRGIDVVVGFVETHGRIETSALIGDLEVVPRRTAQYRSVTLEEMDLEAIISRRPSVAIVDELAHTNVPGSPHGKRWEDVQELLERGISVVTALNIQHIESLNDIIQETVGVAVRETVPDWVVTEADEVINIDISAEDLRQRLIDGKIYAPEKVTTALQNFLTNENLTTLRELALREVASNVDLRREAQARDTAVHRSDSAIGGGRDRAESRQVPALASARIVVAMSSDPPYTRVLLRKASRIAGRLNSDWYCVYVQTANERADRIDAAVQRRLVDNIQLAQAMGAEVVKLEGDNVAVAICEFSLRVGVSLIIVGQSRRSRWQHLRQGSVINQLVSNRYGLDVMIVGSASKKTCDTADRKI